MPRARRDLHRIGHLYFISYTQTSSCPLETSQTTLAHSRKVPVIGHINGYSQAPAHKNKIDFREVRVLQVRDNTSRHTRWERREEERASIFLQTEETENERAVKTGNGGQFDSVGSTRTTHRACDDARRERAPPPPPADDDRNKVATATTNPCQQQHSRHHV